jgi:glucosamine-6-phosphate deaminase
VTGVEVRRAAGPTELARLGADVFADVVRSTPDARVVVATGQSPLGTYREVASRVAAGELDASNVTPFQLDEYVDLEPGDRRSLGRWALETFVRPLRIPDPRFVRLPLGGPEALAAFDARVSEEGGFDLAILGIGANGHIGFNEPPSDAAAPSRVVELSPASIASNAAYWGEGDVPERAVTIGMAPLLAARTILLVVSGASKCEILRRALDGPVTPSVPASYLRRAGRVVVVADADAWPDEGGTT